MYNFAREKPLRGNRRRAVAAVRASSSTWSSARCTTAATRSLLILAKLAGFSSTDAKAILLLKTSDRGISAQDLDSALRSYEKLQLDTARRVLSFYRTRLKTRAGGAALAAAG